MWDVIWDIEPSKVEGKATNDPRVRRLAEKVAGGAKNPFEKESQSFPQGLLP